MANGQLARDSEQDYDWTDGPGVSSTMDLVDPWRKPAQPIFGTFTPLAVETVTTEDLHEIEERWTDLQFVLDASACQKWRSLCPETEATSPYLLFLNRPDSATTFNNLLAFVRSGLARDNGERLAERLAELRTDLAEDEELPNISMSSVLGLVRFLQDNPQMRDPSLVVSNTGNIRAEWHRSWIQHFVVEFTSNIDARFVLFVADTKALEKKVRISVTCSIASLMEHALPHGISVWAVRP